MIEYIKNILPRLVEHSKDLNRKENFVEKRWVLLDTDNNVHEYFFKRDGTLLLFVNGNGTTGNWEMLDQGRRIMVEFGSESKLLQAAFVNDGLFLLKKSSSNELAFALFDPDVIAESDIEKYIETFFSTPEKEMIPSETIPSGYFKLTKTGHIVSRNIELGHELISEDNSIISGSFPLLNTNIFVVLVNNIVADFFEIKEFSIESNQYIKIKVKLNSNVRIGSRIIDYNSEIVKPNTPFKIIDNYNIKNTITVNENGEVINVSFKFRLEEQIAIAVIVILIFIFLGMAS